MRRLTLSIASLLALAAPGALVAEDAALVLGAEGYARLGRLPGGAEVARATDGLTRLGFEVRALADGGAVPTAQAVAAFLARVPEAERLVVALSGRFATDGSRTWYLTADAGRPGIFGLGPGAGAVSLESVLAVLSSRPSRAVLLLGVDPAAEATFDPWLSEGLGDLEVPQGVTVLTATPPAIAAFLASEMAVPRGDLGRLVTENGEVRAEGYLPDGFVLMPALPAAPAAAAEAPAAVAVPELTAEAALWEGAVALDSLEGYRDYLRVHPQGRFAAQAQAAVAAILAEPNREARLAEEALGLTPEQRRAVQRDLQILDFDPRGVDGIFGPGLRSAVTDWQQQNGFPQTSFLTGEQVARIAAQGARRAAQLETEAARVRETQQAADRAFWEESGAGANEAGLRAYLERYPDGLFAEAAADRIALIDEDRRRAAQAEAGARDRALWERTVTADTVAAYDEYLRQFPQGATAGQARTRRAALAAAGAAAAPAAVEVAPAQLQAEAARAAARAAAQAAEASLGLNALTARVIEQRLDGLGLDPGDVDGRIDGDTRRAIGEYQGASGLPPSGFLDEGTLVRLLADSLGQALED